MNCSISGEVPEEPVISSKSGHLFERRLVEKYIAAEGKCPATGEELSVDDLLPVRSSIRVPTEVVKTRLQSGGEDSVLACCRNVLAVDGPGGFFRGYAAFLARDLPFDAIEFVSYEQLRLMYMAALAASAGGELSGLETSLLGAVAGGLTGALTTPLDTVRARTMNEAGTGKGAPEGSLVMTAQSILAAEGVGGLFAGVVPRSLWLSLGGTVFFSSLEAVQSAL